MNTLQDTDALFHLAVVDFWKEISAQAANATSTIERLWPKVQQGTVSTKDAATLLHALFVDSHRRIKEYSRKLSEHFPTPQHGGNLKDANGAWWVDHYTCGISHWSTLNWFSGQRIQTADGKEKLPGASTHFIAPLKGLPFYIIPITHQAWHEPRRNSDSISIEHVNPGPLTRHEDEHGNLSWKFYAGAVPADQIQERPPRYIQPPFRGATWLQPFTLDQLKNNILLKRLVTAARPGKLVTNRITQHADWRASKRNMGPLWPEDDINSAVFANIPLDTLQFLRDYLEEVLPATAPAMHNDDEDNHSNPEYGLEEPTDQETEHKLLTVQEVQVILRNLGEGINIDGKFGPRTRQAVKNFQQRWNSLHLEEQLKVDGIPGPLTCEKLTRVSERGW